MLIYTLMQNLLQTNYVLSKAETALWRHSLDRDNLCARSQLLLSHIERETAWSELVYRIVYCWKSAPVDSPRDIIHYYL